MKVQHYTNCEYCGIKIYKNNPRQVVKFCKDCRPVRKKGKYAIKRSIQPIHEES